MGGRGIVMVGVDLMLSEHYFRMRYSVIIFTRSLLLISWKNYEWQTLLGHEGAWARESS